MGRFDYCAKDIDSGCWEGVSENFWFDISGLDLGVHSKYGTLEGNKPVMLYVVLARLYHNHIYNFASKDSHVTESQVDCSATCTYLRGLSFSYSSKILAVRRAEGFLRQADFS